jgi:hypothetical protein
MAVGPWVLAALAIVAAGSAVAQDAAQTVTEAPPFDESAFPPEVRKTLQAARDDCAGAGGERVTFSADAVRKLDLTGDRRPDYIIRLRDTRCHGSEYVFCGTGGCEFSIIVALKNGEHRTVFGDRVRAYDILPGKGAKRVRFWLHGSYCGGGGVPSCPKTRRISEKPFAFKEPK